MPYNYLDDVNMQLRRPRQFLNSPDPVQMQQQAQAPQQGPMVPNSPMQPQSQQSPMGDAALRAMLEIEALSPGEKKRSRKQAVIDQLRGYALSGDPTPHWTGALAKGVAGAASAYGQKKMDPEYDAAGEERRRRMQELFGGL